VQVFGLIQAHMSKTPHFRCSLAARHGLPSSCHALMLCSCTSLRVGVDTEKHGWNHAVWHEHKLCLEALSNIVCGAEIYSAFDHWCLLLQSVADMCMGRLQLAAH
jgi:hypothetical protein